MKYRSKLFALLSGCFLVAPQISNSALAGSSRLGPIFLLGDSYLDNAGNSNYLAFKNPAGNQNSNGPSYGMDVGASVHQPLASIGRYTPAGQLPNPLGHCYAVGGALISQNGAVSNYGLNTQVNQLLTDYNEKLPTGSIVIINIGINDIDIVVLVTGGQWTDTSNSVWTVNGNQTLPAAGSKATIKVKNTIGAVVGKQINIPWNPSSPQPAAVTGLTTTTISFVVPTGFGGLQLKNGANFTTYAQAYIQYEMQPSGAGGNSLSTLLTNLVNAGATITMVSPPDVSLLPANSGIATLSHWTYLMYVYELNKLIATRQKGVRIWDMNKVMSDIVANPQKYGFKTVRTGWGGASSTNPDDFLFWDSFHPSAAGHRALARSLLGMLNDWGFMP